MDNDNNTDNSSISWSEIRQSGHFKQLLLLCFGVWLHAADGLMVATIIPSVIADIGGAKLIAWNIALYELGSIVAGAASALLSRKYGLRLAMSAAAVCYLVGCLISAISPSMSIMLTGRLLQGLGGGGLVALSFISVVQLFPRGMIPRAIAALSLVWGISAFSGPLVGGVFAHLQFWRGSFYCFAIQAALLAVCLSVALANSANTDDSTVSRFPIWRLCVLCLAILAIASAGIHVSLVSSPLLVVLGWVLLGLFLRLDARHDQHRLLPRRPFDLRHGIGAAFMMVLCFMIATIALSIYGPMLMKVIYGASALTAGYVLVLEAVAWSSFAFLSSGVAEKHDSRLIVTGMVLVTLSIVGLAFSVPYGSLILIAIFAFLQGAGFGLSWTFILRKVSGIAALEERDRVASALPTIQRLGYAVGAASIGIVANALGFTEDLDILTAQAVGFWIFALSLPFALIGLFACYRFISAGVPPSPESVQTSTAQ